MKLLKFFAFTFILLLFFAGHYLHTRNLAMSFIVSLYSGILVYFAIDLVLAKGRLDKKITAVKLASIFYIPVMFIIFFNSNYKLLIILLCLSILVNTALIIYDLRPEEKDYLTAQSVTLPKSMFGFRPFLTFMETVFRLFPNPYPIGLYRIGQPDQTSPVYVTGNYELTVRRVAKSLETENAFLLVSDSRGINVWCSSLSGHFSQDDIISAIKMTRLDELTAKRVLILPQLASANIDREQIYRQTGFHSAFGPANIRENSRLVTFHLKERLEMAIGTPFILSALLIIVYNFFGLFPLVYILPLLYLLSLVNAVIFPYRFIKNIFLWSLFLGGILFILLYFSKVLSPLTSGVVSFGFFYIINEFSGWSPLIKYQFVIDRKAKIEINETRCTACKSCETVCPKGVYEITDTAYPVHMDECILCKACLKQCPADAITITKVK